jgi:Fe2+ transport system protein B
VTPSGKSTAQVALATELGSSDRLTRLPSNVLRQLVALAGNPNSGKTTIFNDFTGACQHVGNYSGVTVEKKEGRLTHRGHSIHVVDLPGTYSLTAYRIG